MKVLFIQNIAAIAGSEKYFLQLLPKLKDHNIDVHFYNFYLKENKELALEFNNLLQELNIPVYGCETNSYVSLKVLFNIKSTIGREKFDIVHSHLVYSDFLVSLVKLISRFDFKLVSTLHGYQEDLYFKYCLKPKKMPKTLYYYIMKFSFSKMDGVYACSYGLKNFFKQIGLQPKSEIEVIHHGFDYAPIEKEKLKSLKFGSPQLLIVGRLVKRKGHHFVLKNLDMLLKMYPSLQLIIAGNGELEEEIMLQIKEYQLKNHVKMLGYRKDTLELMAASDVILVPSYAEGLPLVIFEAFHSGTPVVAFDTIGCNEGIEHEFSGLLARPFNGRDFLDKVESILENTPISKKFSIQAKENLFSKFSKGRMVKNTIAFYKRQLAS